MIKSRKYALCAVCLVLSIILCSCIKKDNTVSNRTEKETTSYAGDESTTQTRTEIQSSESQTKNDENLLQTEQTTEAEKVTEKVTEVEEITKTEAINIAKEVLKRYELYLNFCVSCDYESISEDVSAYMTDYQKTWSSLQFKCTCCNTIQEAIEHRDRYLDESVTNVPVEDFVFNYNGNVYIATAPRGYDSLDIDNLVLVSYDKERIVVDCSKLILGGETYPADRYVITKRGDNFVLTDIE